MRTITNDEDQLWVDVEGTGAPVLLVHGLGGTSTVFEPLTERLSGRSTVLRFDLRGHGRSSTTSRPSIGAWADDLDWLLDSIPTASADFVGIGLGALVLEHYVATRPDRVRRLVLVNPLHGLDEHHRARYKNRAEAVRANGLRVLLDLADEEFGANPETSPTILRALRRELLLAQDPEQYASACEVIASAHTSDLHRTDAPTLVLAGSDATESLSCARTVAERIATAELVELGGLADWPTIEQPTRLTDRIEAFLDPPLDGAA
ncbi:MAG: alpha/beta hydrolase [Actinomycetota bacterium]